MNDRDDFSEKTKQLLAKRVGFKCSKPLCRVATFGPSQDPTDSVNIGVAAHITAASKGGPRYNKLLTSEQRSDPNNGIWLCQNCAKLIDSDQKKYTPDVLYGWKYAAEFIASLELGKPTDSTDILNFQDALMKMPKLLASLSKLLKDKKRKFIREFFVLRDRNIEIGGTSKRRVAFFEENYEDLRLKLDILHDYGFVKDVTEKNVPIFRITPHFEKLLLTDIQKKQITTEDLEKEFEKEMFSLYKKAKSECNYNARRYFQMLDEYGARITANILLSESHESADGFINLCNLKRPELTIEASVLRPKWKNLFTDDERKIAEKRLSDMGYSKEEVLKKMEKI